MIAFRDCRARWWIVRAALFSTALFSIAWLTAIPCRSAEGPIAWHTGDAFRQQLELPIGFRWKSTPLRPALTNLSRNQQVAVWLDRRIDPDQSLDLSVQDLTLDDAFEQISSTLECGVSQVDAVVYLGPRHVSSKLATLAAIKREEVKKLPAATRARFESRAAWHWDDLATPRELLEQLAAEANLKVANLDRVPHDLWPANALPPLPLTDRLTLFFAGFDMSFDVAPDGSAIRPAPLPATVVMEQGYTPRGSLAAATTTIVSAFPHVEIKQVGTRLMIGATFEEHAEIARLVRGERVQPRSSPVGETGYDLQALNQPIGAILKLVAERSKLTVQIAPDMQAKLEQRVSLEVKQAKLAELLDKLLTPNGVKYRLNGNVLELSPSDE